MHSSLDEHLYEINYISIAGKKSGTSNFCQFEKFDVVQALLSFFDTIPAESLKIYFILLFSFSKCPLFWER
jgi:hypothetical protein